MFEWIPVLTALLQEKKGTQKYSKRYRKSDGSYSEGTETVFKPKNVFPKNDLTFAGKESFF